MVMRSAQTKQRMESRKICSSTQSTTGQHIHQETGPELITPYRVHLKPPCSHPRGCCVAKFLLMSSPERCMFDPRLEILTLWLLDSPQRGGPGHLFPGEVHRVLPQAGQRLHCREEEKGPEPQHKPEPRHPGSQHRALPSHLAPQGQLPWVPQR